MLDLNFVRDHLPEVEQGMRHRGMDPEELLGGFRELDARRRQAITNAENLKARRNRASEEVGKLKRSGQDATALMEETKSLREEGERHEKLAAELETELRGVMAQIPNLPLASVPVGNSEHDNVEVRRWGAPPEMKFAAKPHWEIGEQLGMLDLHTREHGYTEVLPPYMVNSTSMYGTGQLPKFAGDSFKCADHDLWLVPTAEVPLTNLYRDETLEADRLPVSVTAYTPCFRSEAGSYGKDVRGIIRQHQFQKVELVKFSHP